MRVRRVLAVALIGVAAASAAGCGGAPLAQSTAPIAEGTEVSSQRYLADVDTAADAIRAFSAALEGLGPVARPAALRAVAPDLAVALQRANAVVARLDAQRLADARLERQRAAAVPVLRRVVAAMTVIMSRAAAGEAAPAVAAMADFRTAVEQLRTLGSPSA